MFLKVTRFRLEILVLLFAEGTLSYVFILYSEVIGWKYILQKFESYENSNEKLKKKKGLCFGTRHIRPDNPPQ